MKFQLIFYFIFIFRLNALEENSSQIKFKGSYGHTNHRLTKIGPLNESLNLTLTIVTGSLENSKLVADHYSLYGKNLTIYEQTTKHVKLNGKVSFLSQIFNTTFVEYKCDFNPYINDEQRNRQKCYAPNSDVSIPVTLKSSIIGILGLEVLKMQSNTVSDSSKSNNLIKSFIVALGFASIFFCCYFSYILNTRF